MRRLLVRLGREHPYHTLYHLLALKHGDYNKDGKPGAADHAEGGMLRTVDAEKVAAAGATLAAIRADPSRSASRACCSYWHHFRDPRLPLLFSSVP